MDGVEIPPNIKAAIRRSRAARRALHSRRRRMAAAVAGLCLVTAIPLSLTFTDFSTGDVLEAAVSKAQSLADMLGKRSPGERTAAQLTKTKHARVLAKGRPAPKPAETALAKILMGPPGPLPVELAAAPLPIESAPPPLATILAPPAGGSVIIPPGGGGTIVPPGGGGPGGPLGGGGPGSPPPNKPPIVTPPGQPTPPDHPNPPPVPEPATWAMMLVGFGLIGWRVRHAPRTKLAAA